MSTSERPIKRVCVFAGSSAGAKDDYAAAARDLGHALVERGIGLVFGGGRVGLMGILADAVLAGGGEAIGVMPKNLLAKEIAHRGLSELKVVDTMHERKAMMGDLAHAFVALPGGWGTLDEFCEVLTWAQLGLHRKPCGLLNVNGYFDGLLAFAGHAVEEGFVRRDHVAMICVSSSPASLIDLLATHRPPVVEKWIARAQT